MDTINYQKCVDILKQARKSIEYKKQHYICYAIDATTARDLEKAYLKEIINTRLNYNNHGSKIHTYAAWIWRYHKTKYKKAISPLNDTKLEARLRKGRLAWIDSLIKEFEDKVK